MNASSSPPPPGEASSSASLWCNVWTRHLHPEEQTHAIIAQTDGVFASVMTHHSPTGTTFQVLLCRVSYSDKYGIIQGVRCVCKAGGTLARARVLTHTAAAAPVSVWNNIWLECWGKSALRALSTSWGRTLSRALRADWRLQARPWSLPPVTHQHDFHWRPRAGGAPSGKNKQTWRPWECKCTDPAHMSLSEYGSSAPAILAPWACFWHVSVCSACTECSRLCHWESVWLILGVNSN